MDLDPKVHKKPLKIRWQIAIFVLLCKDKSHPKCTVVCSYWQAAWCLRCPLSLNQLRVVNSQKRQSRNDKPKRPNKVGWRLNPCSWTPSMTEPPILWSFGTEQPNVGTCFIPTAGPLLKAWKALPGYTAPASAWLSQTMGPIGLTWIPVTSTIDPPKGILTGHPMWCTTKECIICT